MEDSQDDLLKFLRERGVAEEKIEMFIENKIDCNVVLLMDEKIMETYLPAYGDQVATVAFCKARTRPNVNHEGTDGRNVTDTVERLRLKLNSRRRTSSQVHALSGKGAPSGNTYARKLQRRLELGWMDFIADSNEYKQVRAKSGGGVRHLCVDKDITLGEVGEIGKQTFFPSDRSKRGHIDQFTIELRDFQGCLSDPNETVKVAYEKSKLRMLRFYLYSKKIPVEKVCSTARSSKVNHGKKYLES